MFHEDKPSKLKILIRAALLCVTVLLAQACSAPQPAPAPVTEPSASDRALEALELAESAIQDGDMESAEFYLQVASQEIPSSLRSRYRRAVRELNALKADPDTRVLANATSIVNDMDSYDTQTGLELLRMLEAVPSPRLEQEARGYGTLAPWAALSLSVRNTLIAHDDLLDASRAWETANPLHPVDAQRYMELAWQYGLLFSPPARVAVMLPGEGGLNAAGEAIRDGIMSAYLDVPTTSQLTFMPVADDPFSALDAYQRATDLGYDWIIGPLRRESVQMMVDQGGGMIPALMLNWPAEYPAPEEGKAPTLYGLALSQQAEAASIARVILQSGYRRVLLLLADNSWGERAESAFIDALLEGEGDVVALERFNANDADHSAKLTGLLKIEDSRQRKSGLQGALGIQLSFEATRRDDFDVIFMAVDPELGRQLKPQLRFYDAGNKPVFAMSRIWSGQSRRTSDQDLNGIVVPLTRWDTQDWADTPAGDLASARGGAFGSLHALGRDAWNLLPWLGLMTRDPEFVFPGAVGDLSVGPAGQLVREPVWTMIRNGQPVSWTPPPPPEP